MILKVTKKTTVKKVEKALVECSIFSDDVPEWLNQAAIDLINELKIQGLELKEIKKTEK